MDTNPQKVISTAKKKNWSKPLLFICGILVLFASEILRVYFIMPFPGSQQSETIAIAYFIHSYIWLLRFVGIALISYPIYTLFASPKKIIRKTFTVLLFLLYGIVFYFFNFKFLAEKIFYQPEHKILASGAANIMPPETVILGVALHGQAKAYPLELIGYHHQVRDTIGGEPMMITYCTVCRTGRAWSPLVNGVNEQFRLVGMDHFNAMFEDATTGSWWRQVSGEAIAGKLKGSQLHEIPSRQMTLQAWTEQYPETVVMQPDTVFSEQYRGLQGFGHGKLKSKLIGRNANSWQPKSWVVGITQKSAARAYDWNDLLRLRTINDTLAGTPIVVVVAPDSSSFYAWNRTVATMTLNFSPTPDGALQDAQTQSLWSRQGLCVEGTLKGTQLAPVQAYQEFWHSWRTFHALTSQFKP